MAKGAPEDIRQHANRAQQRGRPQWAAPLFSVSVVYLASVPSIYHIDDQRTVVHRINNAILANAQAQKIVTTFSSLDIPSVWQLFNGGTHPAALLDRKSIDKFFRPFLEDDLIHHTSPHSRLQSSRE